MAAGAWLKQQEAMALLGGTDFTHLTTVYVALLTGAPTDQDGSIGSVEVSGGGYARVAVSTGSSYWTTPSQSGANTPFTSTNVGSISFGTSSGAWGTITYFALMTALSGGHLIGYGAISSPPTIGTTTVVLFAAGQLTASLS